MGREAALWAAGFRLVAGVDEAGRGPLAGPVVAGAVILPRDFSHPRLDDSKRMSLKAREELAGLISERARAWAVAWTDPAEVDAINIHQASLLAMRRAVQGLGARPDYALVDGRFTPDWDLACEAQVGGDGRTRCIAAASVLAKVHRDRLMCTFHQRYPVYNFAANKGYPTAEHREALARYGPCPIHRQSYRPVAQRAFLF